MKVTQKNNDPTKYNTGMPLEYVIMTSRVDIILENVFSPANLPPV